jgi:hypothetical protein
MTNRIYQWMLLGLMTMGLSLSVTSCKDDDKDSSEEQKQLEEEAAQTEKAFKFYEVVSQLADLSDMTSNYESQTFEPIIGDEAEGDPLTRIVSVNDMATAAEWFSELISADVSEDTPSFTYDDPDVGTLTYTRTNDGTSWATVDVNIKQVPGLKKIVYQSAEQAGTNGSFRGSAYYRFGDVIQRTYTSKPKKNLPAQICTEYWICVRPAFGLEDKGNSHWVCLNELPEDNMEYVDGSNHTQYYVPTKVCSETKHMQNLAELLYAIFHPDQWKQNLDTYHGQGLKMFEDFQYRYIDYHNECFWRRVQEGWKENNIAQLAFNMNSFEELQNAIDAEGLNLLYKGYSWKSLFYWDCELYTARYSNGNNPSEKNFHLEELGVRKVNMKGIHFDCHRMGKNTEDYREFFGALDDTRRWVIRYASGKQLMSRGSFNKFESITGSQEVWRYNEEYGPTQNLSNTPPERAPKKFEDRGFYTPSDVVRDEHGNHWICMQSSGYNEVDGHVDPNEQYAYFVSFDQGALGDNLANLPSKNLAMQMLYSMDLICKNSFVNRGGIWTTADSCIRKNANVDLMDIIVLRDTLHAFGKNPNHPELVQNDFTNTLYRDENGQLCVLRLINDFTAEMQDGTRLWAWGIYDSYSHDLTTNPRRMMLSDLADQNIINTYNKDKWVRLPWRHVTNRNTFDTEVVPSPGYHTAVQDVANLNRFIYVRGRTVYNGNIPTNMYNEPIVVFAVKRVHDAGMFTGRYEGDTKKGRFEDGTEFTKVSFGVEDEYRDILVDFNTYQFYHTYHVYNNYLTLNGQHYQWGMGNPIGQ